MILLIGTGQSALESIDSKAKRLTGKLRKPLLIAICGDQGEYFEESMNWGRGSPADKVMEVPLIIGKIK